MKRFLFLITLFATTPIFADDVCPVGYEPAEYVELEYISASNTSPIDYQYIDTGMIGDGNTAFEIEYTALNNEPDTQPAIIGSRASRTTNALCLWADGSNRRITLNYANLGSVSPIDGKDKKQHIVSFNKGVLSIDGYDTIIQVQTFTTPSNLLLFDIAGGATGFGGHNAKLQGAIYYTKIWQDNTLVRDFIPVRRLSDNAIGMLDKVEGKFYGNSGIGEFIAGPETGNSFIIDEHNVSCALCPANTYKPNVGNESCTPCPDGTFSPIGSTSLSDCAKILHVNGYVAYMPVGRRTEHGLCTMFDGKKYCADMYEKQ